MPRGLATALSTIQSTPNLVAEDRGMVPTGVSCGPLSWISCVSGWRFTDSTDPGVEVQIDVRESDVANVNVLELRRGRDDRRVRCWNHAIASRRQHD